MPRELHGRGFESRRLHFLSHQDAKGAVAQRVEQVFPQLFVAIGFVILQLNRGMIMHQLIPTGEATAILPTGGKSKPITVIGTEAIRGTFDELCLQQAINSRLAPGVTDLVLNPDAHCGYGAPIGCVLVSPTHIYPGPVGVDIKCSMSLLQLDLPADADRRPADAPGADQRHLRAHSDRRRAAASGTCRKRAGVDRHELGRQLLVEGASPSRLHAAGHSARVGQPLRRRRAHRATTTRATRSANRLDRHLAAGDACANFADKITPARLLRRRQPLRRVRSRAGRRQRPRSPRSAEVFGLADGHVAFLSHCGSRGIGHNLAMGQFRALQHKFATWEHPAAGRRPGTGLRAARHARGRRLPRRHGPGRELRHGQPPADQRARAGGVSGGLSRRARASSSTSSATTSPARRSSTTARPGSIARERRGRFPAGHHALKDTPLRRDRPSDPPAGQPAGRLERDGRRRRCAG